MGNDELFDLLASPARLRERIAERLQWEANRPLGLAAGDEGAREVRWPAAVLAPLVLSPAGPQLLLTRRTAHLAHHPGQISFPGGRMEPGDPGPVEAALRETEEEIGLSPQRVQVLGALPPYVTITGYRITPLVGWVEDPGELRPDPFEVAEVFTVPLSHVLDPRRYVRYSLTYGEQRRHYWAVPWRQYFIWGATAAMLRTFLELLLTDGHPATALQCAPGAPAAEDPGSEGPRRSA
ncbi:MAG: CoA pyrophosphatase [Rhodocyclales bacterium]|nr:CoA pyrophosphatase [Rhodocyclales bacterium]